jgi:hypothetical protein
MAAKRRKKHKNENLGIADLVIKLGKMAVTV